MQDPNKLRVSHLARALAIDVIKTFPPGSKQAVPGLRQQSIRAATSVHANIAEGCGRATRPDFLRHIEIAIGSLNELEAHLSIARGAEVVAPKDHARLVSNLVLVRRMLLALRLTLQRKIAEEMDRAADARKRA